MKRYLYCNLLKIYGLLLILIFALSLIYFICLLLINNIFNLPSLIVALISIVLWLIVIFVANILNKKAKNTITFLDGKFLYNGKTIYKEEISMKYFRFYISIIQPCLVIPKLSISGQNVSLICYLSRKDISRLEELNFEIKII